MCRCTTACPRACTRAARGGTRASSPQLRLATLCEGFWGSPASGGFKATCEHLEDKLLHHEEENCGGSPSPSAGTEARLAAPPAAWALRIHNQHHPEVPGAEQPGAPETPLGAAAAGSIPVPFPAAPGAMPRWLGVAARFAARPLPRCRASALLWLLLGVPRSGV